MFLRSTFIATVAVALAATVSVFAGDKNTLAIKGTVIGDNKKPQPDAEIHVLPLDGKGQEAVVTTNSHGKYIVAGLVVGDYTVTAYDPNGFARSRALIKTSKKGWAKVDFNLGLDKAVGDGGNRIHGSDHLWSASSHMTATPAHR